MITGNWWVTPTQWALIGRIISQILGLNRLPSCVLAQCYTRRYCLCIMQQLRLLCHPDKCVNNIQGYRERHVIAEGTYTTPKVTPVIISSLTEVSLEIRACLGVSQAEFVTSWNLLVFRYLNADDLEKASRHVERAKKTAKSRFARR